MDQRIYDYIEDVKNEFVKGYEAELNEHILDMVQNYGYKEDNLDNLEQWLNDNQKSIKMNEDVDDDLTTRVIFLEDNKTHYTYSLFFIQIRQDENGVMYKFTDVLAHDE